MAKILKYGLEWPSGTHPLHIEMWMIQQGKEYVEAAGRSLFFHYKEAEKILWPRDDHHRWSDLILKTICDNEVVTIIGCSDSCKTWSISKFALTDYWCFPDQTLWLISTTEGRGSELRIWGAIKDLFNEARREFDWLPGNPIDYLKTITTDEVDTERKEARSLRRGMIIIPCKPGSVASGLAPYIGIKSQRLRHAGDETQCFPKGTMVDTPYGPRPIETIRVGNTVNNASGAGIVLRTFRNRAGAMVRIVSKDGRQITCTANHPILTQNGWKKACEVNQSHYMVSTHEAMQALRSNVSSHIQRVLVSEMSVNPKAMRTVREGIQHKASDSEEKILQRVMCGSGLVAESRFQEEILHIRSLRENHCGSQSQSGATPGTVFVHEADSDEENQGADAGDVGIGKNEMANAGQQWSEKNRTQAENPRRQWDRDDSGREVSSQAPSESEVELRYQNREVERERVPSGLQSGYRYSGNKARHRSRRRQPQSEQKSPSGPKEIPISVGAWVDSCQVLEQGHFGEYGNGDEQIEVYNLSVAGHPSYSVNGFLVHNCMGEAHLSSYANWYGKEDFKGINAGNFMEPDDPLGIAAEPENGWESFEDAGKTQTWRGKFYNAAVIALDGRDSPNFDYPVGPKGKPRFPYMIGKKKLDAVAETSGKNSWQWFSQCIGKPVKGMDIWRVLRKDFCQQHKAFDEVTWKGTPRINLYSLDPAYGLGDRCVGRRLEFGEDLAGREILLAHAPEIIPIAINTGKDAETQIAEFIFARLSQLSIPASNCFYDSFGRGTLGFSFAKVFGATCPVPIDSGAQPSARPVRFDLYVEERNGSKRLKRCDEHYTKFISELWFSVSETIESEQMRGIDADTIREGCARKFIKNNQNKIEVEPKEDMKERLRRSPDLMDNLAIGVEGARRLGFKIQRLVAESDDEEASGSWSWFKDLHNRARDMREKQSLRFSR